MISSFGVFGQQRQFEGEVIYKVEIKNPNPNIVPDSVWDARVKDKIMYQKYYYKGDKYKSVISKKAIQLYDSKENALLNYNIENDTILINSIPADKSIDPVKSITHEDTAKEILGYKCQKLIVTGKLSKTTYYYSTDLKIPAENFKNHNYGNWYQFLKEANSLPLKIITKSGFLYMEMTAIEVKPKSIDDSEFVIQTSEK